MSGQRQSPRVAALHLVTYETGRAEGGREVAVGRTLNVSESGLLVETSRELAPGLHLEIEIAVGDDLVEAKGLVVRCEGPRDDLYETGIQLVEMSSEDRGKLVRQS